MGSRRAVSCDLDAVEPAMGSRAFTRGEFTGAPHPLNEAERHGNLCAMNVLDTAPERRFDDITQLCCMVFKVPIALVSLVDKDRQWFKSVQGLDTNQTDRKSSFCAWTLLPQHPEVLVVPDALVDLRFCKNPLVTGPPDIRFYAGAPLVSSNGLRLGSLCIIDRTQREFGAQMCVMLTNMAEMVVREIEKGLMLAHHKQKTALLAKENHTTLRAMDCYSQGIVLVNASLPKWPVLFLNEAWERATGKVRGSKQQDFWDLFLGEDDEALREKYMSAVVQQKAFDLELSFGTPEDRRVLNLAFRCANKDNLDRFMPMVGIPNILATTPDTPDSATYYFATVPAPPNSARSAVGSGNPTPNNNSSGPQHRNLSRVDSPNNNNNHSSANSSSRGRGGGTSVVAVRASSFQLVTTTLDPFDDVTLGSLLGRGAFGRVYRGQWNGAQVAVKVMEHTREQQNNVGGDIMEALLSGQVAHPNVVHAYKYCSRPLSQPMPEEAAATPPAPGSMEEAMETWMIMEYCNKGSISDAVDRGWFRKKKSLFETDYRSLVTTAREIAGAMCYLHGRNILHGDLTGNNILLASSEKDERGFTAKVADFGLSRVLDGTNAVITTSMYGTVTHMPPELLIDGQMGKPADVYAYGVIMWELFMGQRPYAGLSHGQIIHHITSHKQLQLNSSCPAELKSFVHRCHAPLAADRPTFPDIIELLDELERDLLA